MHFRARVNDKDGVSWIPTYIFFPSQQCSQNDCVSSLHRRIQHGLLRCELRLFFATCLSGEGGQAGGLEASFLLLTRVGSAAIMWGKRIWKNRLVFISQADLGAGGVHGNKHITSVQCPFGPLPRALLLLSPLLGSLTRPCARPVLRCCFLVQTASAISYCMPDVTPTFNNNQVLFCFLSASVFFYFLTAALSRPH